MKFRKRAGIAFATLSLTLTACSAVDSQPLQRFYDQHLAFGSCAGYARTELDDKTFASRADLTCAHLDVPLDYQDPQRRTAQIAVLKVPARGEKIGSLLLNPGGPGGSGLSLAVAAAAAWKDNPITERFDLIGFDPRGVGASSPAVDCFTDAEFDAGQAVVPLAAAVGRWTADDTRGLMDRCAARSGGLEAFEHLGTRDAVRDMDVLRAALGDSALSFAGLSYGTRLGAVYAEMFPRNVRALLLDGAVDPSAGTIERRLSQFSGFQQAFDRMAADCATRPDCPLGTDPAQATAVYLSIVRPLHENPVPAGNGRRLDFAAAFGGVGSGLYDSAAWPVIRKGIAEIRTGRGDTLLALGDALSGRGADGRWSNFLDANYAINCLDEQRRTPEQETELRRRIYAVAPFMDPGIGVEGARDGCEFWPVAPTLGYPYAADVQGLPTTLTISTTGDPATPYDGGIVLARSLGGVLLTVEGNQHTAALAGNDCVDGIVADYLVELKPPPATARCTL
ncbi:alpha/beta hydrolase [Nocardia sp. NPDC127579]|uniref:alpha/beta hydrolase n=1 Tax=Nocardia sp. NPDC127579 TaxID=3345402 RepID=UPI00362F83C7